MGIREGNSLATIACVGFTKQITNQTKSVGLELEEGEEEEDQLRITGATCKKWDVIHERDHRNTIKVKLQEV